MRPFFSLIVLSLPVCFGGAFAQQTVSTPGGVPGAVPKFSDGTTLVNSSITDVPGNLTIANAVTFNAGELVFPTINLFSPHGVGEFNSSTGILFSGQAHPSGYALISASGTDFSGPGNGILTFWTANAGVLQPNVVISPFGNIGIGTTAPGGELSIVLDSGPETEAGAHIVNTNPTGYSVLRLGSDSIAAQGFGIHQFNAQWPGDPAGPTPPLGTSFLAFEQGGMTFANTNQAAPIRFFTAGGGTPVETLHISPRGFVGIGTSNPTAVLEVDGGLTLTNGSKGVITFQDGTTQGSAASSTYNATTGIVSFNAPIGAGATPGIQFSPVAQGVGGTFGAGGNLALQANSLIDTTATGGYMFLGGSQRGDGIASKVYITGNQTPGSVVTTSAIVVNSANNVGLGIDPHKDPAARLEINGGLVFTSGSIGTITFADGSIQTTAANTASGGAGSSGIPSNLNIQGSGGGLVVSGSNLDPTVQVPYAFSSLQGSGKLLLGWNLSSGGGEQDFIGNRGAGSPGGFSFYDYGNDGTLTKLAGFSIGGNSLMGNTTLVGAGASVTFPDGSVQATAWNGTTFGGDYAEAVDVNEPREEFELGDLMSIDPSHPGRFTKSNGGYSKLVAGVYSTKPGLTGRRTTYPRLDRDAEIPMAMLGIVPLKVTTENGIIEPGDLLVSSSQPGLAMKGTEGSRLMGSVIGKSLDSCKSATCKIEALITLQ